MILNGLNISEPIAYNKSFGYLTRNPLHSGSGLGLYIQLKGS